MREKSCSCHKGLAMRFDTGVKIKSAKNGTSPLVFEASSQLLNYISLRARHHRSASRANFHHFAITPTACNRYGEGRNEIKCSKKCQRVDSFGIEQFDASILYLSQQPLLRGLIYGMQWNEALCAARLLWLIPFATHIKRRCAALLHLFYCTTRWPIKQHWCDGVTRQVFIASLLKYLRPKNHGNLYTDTKTIERIKSCK